MVGVCLWVWVLSWGSEFGEVELDVGGSGWGERMWVGGEWVFGSSRFSALCQLSPANDQRGDATPCE